MSDDLDDVLEADDLEPTGADRGNREGDEPEHGEPERGEVVYDCSAWAGETRRLLAGMLDNAQIDQAWQGASLTVRVADEERVDEIIDELLETTTQVALPDDAETVVFATAGWSVAMQTALVTALAEDDIAYEWDEQGDLRVLAQDDEAVALLLDEIAEEDHDLVSSDDGVALQSLLGEVFGSASKLVKRPRDAASLVRIAEAAELMGSLAIPFGFERAQWAALVQTVGQLAEVIDSDAPDDAVSQSALATRNAVRPFV